ncbi:MULTISPECIES: trypsin-like peptidase domain-containing protein [unclassified Bradyrhizobium]|uniref:trypsin-like peptidase domain-containing protein n=1 Tax=unclassified Bradyrhizobium TaxID=2631580 RepID=UPI00230575E2|nr:MULTISPECIES: trypsin-like peptidase domain-containing protein [unclassified Bradyrhizobium]MDA9406503.1 hypothetical protein [Bradyrhizobium sp. CCBAU 45384]MDA9444048.1 hypothetical protein [Bradyrhizobium sp. CCBAU 51745]
MDTIKIDRAMGIIEVKRRDPIDPKSFEHCGMGILISPRVAITCAHVVNAAVPRMVEVAEAPDEHTRITVLFPMVEGQQTRQCRVTKWRKMGKSPLDDIAILELDQPAPTAAGVNVLAEIVQQRDETGDLSLFGVRGDRELGEHVSARLLGQSSPAWRQIVSDHEEGIEPGFSGAGVWDETHQATIGMAVRGYDSKVAFFLPAKALIRFAEDIPYERRDLSAVFSRNFTVLGTAFFFAALFHLLADRIREFPKFLSLGLGNEILAAFWGLHLIVVFMPFLLRMLLSFAKAYREHPWWMRIPQFGYLGDPARPAASRFAAIATLVLLVAGPLYLSGHFMRRLHSNEMKVYIDAKAFGYDPSKLVAAGQSCGPGLSAGYCTHPCATLYSLVPPAEPGKSGYVNNYYQIGGLDRHVPESVTFYPIVQPIALWVLTAACFILSALLVWRVAKPARRLLDAPAPNDYLLQ